MTSRSLMGADVVPPIEEEWAARDVMIVLLGHGRMLVSGMAGSQWIEDHQGRARVEISGVIAQAIAEGRALPGSATTNSHDLPIGAELAGHRIEAIIGRGGMGVVYRARDLVLERVVALKVLAGDLLKDSDFADRFLRESRLAASIRHPNVVCTHRAGVDRGLLFITMDLIEGTDLGALLHARGRLEPSIAASIVAQVADGLDAAHQLGLVHRDVKPANVLVEGGPHGPDAPLAVLTDFGLCKRTLSESALTPSGAIVGTVDYIAPEQLQGGPVDRRAARDGQGSRWPLPVGRRPRAGSECGRRSAGRHSHTAQRRDRQGGTDPGWPCETGPTRDGGLAAGATRGHGQRPSWARTPACPWLD
jgi:hypothetical protein